MDSSDGSNALLDRQQQQEQGLFDQYTQAVNSQPKMTDIFNNLQNQYGIPDAQKQLQGYKDQTTRVQGLLNNLVPDIAARTQGTLTSQAMRDRMQSVEAQPLNQQIQALGIAEQPLSDLITSGNDTISKLLPLYSQDQQMALDPLKTQLSMLDNDFSRQLTAYEDQMNRQASASSASALASYLNPASLSSAATPSLPSLASLPDPGNGIRARLSYLAGQGNSDAQTALQYVGNDGNYYLDPYVTNPTVLNALNNLGFTNVWKAASSASSGGSNQKTTPFINALVSGQLR